MRRLWKYCKTVVSFISLAVLVCPAVIRILAVGIGIGAIIAVSLCVIDDRNPFIGYVRKRGYIIVLAVITGMSQTFYLRWLPSSSIALIARMLHIPSGLFLRIVSVVICFTASYSIWVQLNFGLMCLKKVSNKSKKEETIMYYASVLLVLIAEYVSLEFSSLNTLEPIYNKKISLLLVNLWIIVLINLLILLIMQTWKKTLFLTSIVFFIWSIANYYTIIFHGSPLYPSEFVNAGTAMAVISGYHFALSLPVICLVLFWIVQFVLIVGLSKKTFGYLKWYKRFAVRASIFIIGTVCFIPLYVHASKANESWMPWRTAIEFCGFALCAVEDVRGTIEPVIEPAGYSDVLLLSYSSKSSSEKERETKPDIILILNETFCDIGVYTDIEADVDYMSDYYNIQRAVYGYAIVPDIGGGTNNSEFELLMSKSMHIMASNAPFTYLNAELLSRSVVAYLENLGYSTCGMHCGGEKNYSRDSAYPEMGFNTVILGPDAFKYINDYGKRSWLDSDNYHDMEEYYESAGNDPRFIYMLTFQNHGGYEQNDDSMDTVHVYNDLNDLTDDVNEYLSSIQLSCKAFRELTEYFEKSDRDVIICMVGDHAPAFIRDLPEKENHPINDSSINMRTVPYVIWSNFEMEQNSYTDYAGLTDLVPMVLDTAGIPMSTFYSKILDLHESLPVRTRDGKYLDRDLQMGLYNDQSPYFDQINEYYYFEYNSLLPIERYSKELFELSIIR